MAVRGQAMVPSTASRVLIRLDAYTRDSMNGHLYCPYAEKDLAFHDVMDFINKLDGLFDEIAFPLAAMEYRSFKPRRRKRAGAPEPGERKVEDARMEGDRPNPKDTNTFVVHVQFRQNATWQGTVKWAGQNQEQRFRSTLELLKIMDSVINADAAQDA